MAGKTWSKLNCLKHQEIKDHTKKKSQQKGPKHSAAITEDPHSQRSDPEGCIDHDHNDDIAITEDLIDPEYLLDPPENWRLDINATSDKELGSNGHCIGTTGNRERRLAEKKSSLEEVILPPNKMSVAVQVVNGREQGAEEEELQEAGGGSQEVQEAGEGTQETGGEAQEIAGAQAMETKMEVEPVVPSSPKEEVLSDSELDHSGAPKKKKFKAWKSIKKIFKKKKSSKGSEGDSVPSKSKSKSTSELETGGDEEGELNKRISMSEDSVFTPDKPASAKDRSSYSLNTSNLTDEISAKLKERASSSDDGYAQSSEDAMTTGDTTHDNSYVAPSDSSKTDSGIITTEDEKSFTSVGIKDSHHVTSDMKRLKTENPGDVDLDLIKTSNLLSSSAAKHRISVAPSNRRPSRKARAWTPEKRSSSRLDDAPTPIAEEPTTPTKSPVPLDLDSELPFPGVALTTSPTPRQHSNGSSSIKPKANKGLGPMVLPPILPPFGPKGTGSRSRKVESTPTTTDSQSTNLDIASDSATFPTKEDQSVSKSSKVDLIENQKNGKDVVKEKGRHEDIEKLLEVDPALFGDDIKLREDDSTKKLEGNKEDSKMTSKGEDGGLGLVDSGSEEKDDGGVGVGLGIADLDLLVDLPDPLDLGKNMFGVETIVEEDEEEEEAGEEMEGSDDFLEEDSSMEDVEEVTVEKVESKNGEIEEEKVKGKVAALVNKAEEETVKEGKVTTVVDKDENEKIKVGTVAAMISEVEEEIRKSPPGERKGQGRETTVMKKRTEEEKDIKETGRKDNVGITKKDKLVSSMNKEEANMPSTLAAKSEMAYHVAMDTDTTHDKDDDNDNNLNDSNYPGINGRLPTEDSVKGTVKLSREDEEKGDTPKKDAVPVVIIESPSSDDLKTSKDTTLEDGEEEEEEEPIILPQVPKEVIIIMKDEPKKDDLAKKEEEKEAKPSTPTTPEAPTPVEMPSPEEDAAPASPSPPPAEMKKKEEVEKESAETEKDVEEVKKKEEEDPSIVEERRLSVAASKALFEAKIPASEPYKSSNKAMVNGSGTPKTDTRRASAPIEPVPETKAEADTKLSEKEEKKEEAGEKDEADKEEAKEEPVSLKDRISRYQNLATNSSVKGLTAHVPTRNSPTKQRPQSTSNIENKDSPKKLAPKMDTEYDLALESSMRALEKSQSKMVLSKPSSISSSKPSGSTATTTEHSNPSTNPPPSSTTTTASSPRKPLQPKIDRCMVCQKAVYPNEMSKFEGRVFHRTCQKCSECSRTLTLWNLDIAGDQLYCKQHGTVVKNNQLKEELIMS